MRYRLRTLLIVIAALAAAPSLGQEKNDPGDAIYGEWEVEECVYKGKAEDLRGMSGGWFVFDSGGVIRIFGDEMRETILNDKPIRKLRTNRYTIRNREIDIELTPPIGNGSLVKGLYDLKDGKLRIIWPNDAGERPTDFDEAYKNPRLTLYVLKKVK